MLQSWITPSQYTVLNTASRSEQTQSMKRKFIFPCFWSQKNPKIGKSMLLVGQTFVSYQECNVMISTTKIVLVCQNLFCQMLEQVVISIFLSHLFLNKIISLTLG
ncbi:unnamed protein product [Leptidea sinapis]|uniref:Uncharacterized protein n=1 Tax=Leptidea sinapis TaxID=189913 RepID=A0A5E4PTN2_9NEOP|nr:unnamed protein product [Leptidea sinapis]